MRKPLTDTAIKKLKPQEKPYKKGDSHGLYILIHPNGSKYWRQKYRINGREKLLSHGTYPLVSLSEARELRDKARKLIKDGVDPINQKRIDRRQAENTFKSIAIEWHATKQNQWTEKHAKRVIDTLTQDIFPSIGNIPINEIQTPQVIEALKRIERRGALEVAGRVAQRVNAVFKYAMASGLIMSNPATDVKVVLKKPIKKQHNALEREDLPEFFDRLRKDGGHPVVKLATRALVHTFVRTGELRQAKWSEFNLEERLWRVPKERMKMGVEHLVPLSDQMLLLLEDIRVHTGNREYVFASPNQPRKPLSENGILQCLYRMGYKGIATGHGFRATASTILHEMGYNSDAIERQLSHGEKDKVKAAYNRSKYLDDRVKIMQGWSDYLLTVQHNDEVLRG